MSHRAVMFGSVANGQTKITGLLASEDIERTMTVFQQMGVSMTQEDGCWLIDGIGFDGLHAPQEALDMGNSGTTTRLLLGLLAGSAFPLTFYGDQSLSKRPLGRVLTPLKDMGVMLQTETNALPVTLTGKVALHGISYTLPMASAQVKSAILLAGLQASGTTTVIEPMPTRDHTERMLREFGVDVTVRDNAISVQGGPQLTGTNVIIPGDMSSAAFWLTAGLLVPNSQITITQVGVNPTRVGLLRLLERMGANFPALATSDDVEPVMDLQVATQDLQAITVTAEDVPQAIDEMPLLVLAATQAKGTTVISGASELRVKESDRITAVTTELNKLGAHIEERPDGFVIHGGTPLAVSEPTIVEVYDDHRIGMMLAIAALITDGEVQLSDGNVVDISYPTFFNDLEKLMQ
ncbi:3-phosphoshikimate 1-carboxyvinyltransferase [Weissella ceti NC36]|nr:3-phosphoshikimate 1-carboxyvinyltransferase [Weissella ceti NC36]